MKFFRKKNNNFFVGKTFRYEKIYIKTKNGDKIDVAKT